MKRSPKDKDIADNLKPSKFSGTRFLGDDQRSHEEIIDADLRTLRELGVEIDQLAAALKNAFEAASKMPDAETELPDGVTAQYHESRGRVPSPFKGEGTFEKGELAITDTKNNLTIIITALSIHLIEKHGFFQGKGSRYRIDPVSAVKIFRL